jgi:hypothetical protein
MALLHIEGFEDISASTGTSSRTDAANWTRQSDYYAVGFDISNANSPNYHPYVWNGWGYGDCYGFAHNIWARDYFLAKTFDPKTTLITGFAFQPSWQAEVDRDELVTFHDVDGNLSNHFSLRLWLGSHIEAWSNNHSTLLGQARDVCWKERWNYVEVKVTFHNTTGSYEIRVNGITVLSDTNVDTTNGTTSNQADTVAIRGLYGFSSTDQKGQHCIDDWYICDTTGTSNNNFLGPLKVENLHPDGAGDSTQWTPSAGSNYQTVDEVVLNTTDYNSSATSTNKDLFTCGNLTNIDGSVFGVQVDCHAVSTQAEALGIKPKVKRSTSEGTGDAVYIADDNYYQQCQHMFEQDPAAGPGAWTVTNVNAMQIGYEVA